MKPALVQYVKWLAYATILSLERMWLEIMVRAIEWSHKLGPFCGLCYMFVTPFPEVIKRDRWQLSAPGVSRFNEAYVCTVTQARWASRIQ